MKTTYLIYDMANDHVLQSEDGTVITFDSYDSAMAECLGNETVVQYSDLPISWQIKVGNLPQFGFDSRCGY
jgi:hypothetical protein